MAFVVIVFGSFVRLSNAGLSCPDWPTCYGKITWPKHDLEVRLANDAYPERLVESHKAWREQSHRFFAGALGLMVLGLALLSVWRRRIEAACIALAVGLVAAGLIAYMKGFARESMIAAIAGEVLILAISYRNWKSPGGLPTLTLAVVIFQALLGLWTVTWLLKPIVVMGHLLGGMAVFSLLLWQASTKSKFSMFGGHAPKIVMLNIAIVLVVAQIALGGWTSANYAAMACAADFPKCLGQWWPAMDFREAFVLWRGIGVNYEGGVLDLPARTAIQMGHRIGAVLVVGHLLVLGFAMLRLKQWKTEGGLLIALLLMQVALGIANVLTGLPLWSAVLHSAVAALLLALLVHLRARVPERR